MLKMFLIIVCKNLKIWTARKLLIILKVEQFGFTLLLCIQKMIRDIDRIGKQCRA